MKTIYTCLFGDYDTLKHPIIPTPNWKYVCFTDQVIEDNGVWEIRKLALPLVKGTKRLSRYPKIAAPPEGEITLYVDATYKQITDLDEFVKDLGAGVHMTPHPQRQCLYEEFDVIRKKQLDNLEVINKQEQRYRDAGYPENNGLFRCGCIVRVGDCSDFNALWFDEIERGSWRDQPSAVFAAWKGQRVINALPHGHVERHFQPGLHSPRKMEGIYYAGHNGALTPSIPKGAWAYVGAEEEFDSNLINEAATKFPNTHCIKTKKGILFQRWLLDYIPHPSKMLETVKIYNGNYVIYF